MTCVSDSIKRLMIVVVFLCVFLGERAALAQVNQPRVGPNVHVSRAHENYMMGEVLLSADPLDPNRLLGCGIVYAESENWTVVYLSTDGGQNWQPTLETKRLERSTDPACTLGRDGLAYHIAPGMFEKHRVLGVYRSVDGGKTWTQREDIPMTFHVIDRESLVLDTTQGKFGNRIYITGESRVFDLGGSIKNGFAIWHSRDGGATFEGPVKREAIVNHYLLQIGNSVILSDGTLVSLFGDIKNYDTKRWKIVGAQYSEESNAVLEAVTSTDGGDSISEAVKVDDFYMVWPIAGSVTLGMPTLAVDPGVGPFQDRLYSTWADERNGRSEIRFSYSANKGKTWSKSIVIDDVQGPSDNKKGPENFLPTVAVNKAGVVAVTWYDRRENPDGLGWYVRARASLDGGDTWLPSVRVSEKPNTFFLQQKIFADAYAEQPEGGAISPTHVGVVLRPGQFFAGDYAGLAADAGGIFHAFWIDNRTGLPQLWTAPIVVEGRAIRNESPGLAQFNDVSNDIRLQVVSTNYDRASSTVTIGVRLKNSSAKVIQGPVKLRLLNISSTIGSPSAANADNQLARSGAIWDLSPSLKDDALKPGESSAVKELVFRVDHPRELLDGKKIRYRLLDFDVRVLAGGAKSPQSPRSP